MKTLVVTIALVLAMLLAPAPARADVINFDDLVGGISDGVMIASPYHGFTWTNFAVLNASVYTQNPSGYQNGIVSPDNVALNAYGSMSVLSDGLFTLNRGYFTAAWNDGLRITVQGFLHGALSHSVTFSVDTSAPTLEIFNWSGIDSVQFSSAGGTHHTGFGGSGEHFAMDNLEINAVPEPAAITLFMTVAAGLWLAARKRRV